MQKRDKFLKREKQIKVDMQKSRKVDMWKTEKRYEPKFLNMPVYAFTKMK